MSEDELMRFYETNNDFHNYVDHCKRNHPDSTVEDVLREKIVQDVAMYYMQKEGEKQ